MSNIITCQRGYVNRVKFTGNQDDSKNRLNVTVGSTLGFGDKKKYVTYELTIWGKQAVTLQDLIVSKSGNTQGSQVGFVGELEEVVTNVDKIDSSKIYTSLRVKLLGQFQLLGGKPVTSSDEKTSKTKSKIKEEDELEGEFEIDF